MNTIILLQDVMCSINSLVFQEVCTKKCKEWRNDRKERRNDGNFHFVTHTSFFGVARLFFAGLAFVYFVPVPLGSRRSFIIIAGNGTAVRSAHDKHYDALLLAAHTVAGKPR